MARKRTRFPRIFIIIGFLAVLIAAAWFGYRVIAIRKAKFTQYPAFGIYIPNGFEIHGIDVSRYQHLIAWEEVQKMQVNGVKIGFAFMKATEGVGNVDVQFKRNWRKAKDSNIPRGAYHFFIASRDGKQQAENFIKRVELEEGDLPPVLDIEQLNGVSKQLLKKEAKRWLDVVEAYYGVKPIIYTNADFYERNLGSEFDEYPLWVAHYYEQREPRIGRDWHFWQHSDRGNVNGITAKVDFNVFIGDSLEFQDMLLKQMPE